MKKRDILSHPGRLSQFKGDDIAQLIVKDEVKETVSATHPGSSDITKYKDWKVNDSPVFPPYIYAERLIADK